MSRTLRRSLLAAIVGGVALLGIWSGIRQSAEPAVLVYAAVLNDAARQAETETAKRLIIHSDLEPIDRFVRYSAFWCHQESNNPQI
jgi:hypothetical protein